MKSFARRWLRHLGVLFILLFSSYGVLLAIHDGYRAGLSEYSLRGRLGEFFSSVEEQFLDLRMRPRYRHDRIDPDVTMLLIDDLSIKKLGRFPWSREIWARVMNR